MRRLFNTGLRSGESRRGFPLANWTELDVTVEAEIATLLEKHADEVAADGRLPLVRHGHRPEREMVTGVGPALIPKDAIHIVDMLEMR